MIKQPQNSYLADKMMKQPQNIYPADKMRHEIIVIRFKFLLELHVTLFNCSIMLSSIAFMLNINVE